MGKSLMLGTVSCMVLVLCMASSTLADPADDSSALETSQRSDVDELNQLLNSLVVHIDRLRKRSCRIGIGAHNCQLSELDKMMKYKAFLASGASPGKRKRSCRFGIGSHNCQLSELDKMMKYKDFLASDASPGKRSEVNQIGQGQGQGVIPQDVVEEARALQDGLMEQRQVIRRLQRNLVQGLRDTTEQEAQTSPVKRSCKFRLGGHCLTKQLDKAASQYYYLKSSESPGRKRRSVATEAETFVSPESEPAPGTRSHNSLLRAVRRQMMGANTGAGRR